MSQKTIAIIVDSSASIAADLLAREHISVGPYRVHLALTHLCAEREPQTLADLVRDRVDVVEERVCDLAPSLGVHSGAGTVGLCYLPLVP